VRKVRVVEQLFQDATDIQIIENLAHNALREDGRNLTCIGRVGLN